MQAMMGGLQLSPPHCSEEREEGNHRIWARGGTVTRRAIHSFTQLAFLKPML